MAPITVAHTTILTGEVATIICDDCDLTIEFRADSGPTLHLRTSDLPDLNCLPLPGDPVTLICDGQAVILAILGVVILDRRTEGAKAA